MSDIRTIAKPAAEEVKKFNQRLRVACEEMPVTSFECVLADGEPVVTLISEVIEADEQMVKEAGDAELKVGDMVPESDPIEVQVMRIGTGGQGAALAEAHTESINKRARGDVEEVRFVTGPVTDWVRDRNDFDKEGTKETSATAHWVKVDRQAVYAVVAYLVAFEAEGDDEDEPVGAGANGKAGANAKAGRKS